MPQGHREQKGEGARVMGKGRLFTASGCGSQAPDYIVNPRVPWYIDGQNGRVGGQLCPWPTSTGLPLFFRGFRVISKNGLRLCGGATPQITNSLELRTPLVVVRRDCRLSQMRLRQWLEGTTRHTFWVTCIGFGVKTSAPPCLISPSSLEVI